MDVSLFFCHSLNNISYSKPSQHVGFRLHLAGEKMLEMVLLWIIVSVVLFRGKDIHWFTGRPGGGLPLDRLCGWGDHFDSDLFACNANLGSFPMEEVEPTYSIRVEYFALASKICDVFLIDIFALWRVLNSSELPRIIMKWQWCCLLVFCLPPSIRRVLGHP